jgi:hypothetical protein
VENSKTVSGAALLRKKGAPLRGGQLALLAYGGRALSAPPTPSPPKNKKLAVDGGVNPAFEPECRTVLNQAERHCGARYVFGNRESYQQHFPKPPGVKRTRKEKRKKGMSQRLLAANLPEFDSTFLDATLRNVANIRRAAEAETKKNLPIHGLNVIAFARIQTSSKYGFAPRRKGRCAPLTRWPAGQP